LSTKSKLGDWLDERIAHRKILHELLDEPIVGGARWAYVFGAALLLTFVIQIVTGILLMTSYAPSSQSAWASVVHISTAERGGWLVRGLHHFGTEAMIVLLGAHLLQVAIYGAYKRPREVNWWIGLVLLAMTLAFALTGNPLRWDQKGYWAAKVEMGIAGTMPLGSQIQAFLQGGDDFGNLTLTRFHALHTAVLPAGLVVLLVMHLAIFRKHGVTPPVNADEKKVDAFYPRQALRDIACGLLVLAVIFVCTLQDHGAPIAAPADPASDYPARPEWYFAALFQLRKMFHGSAEIVGTAVLPGIAAIYLLGLPFFDKKSSRALGPRLPVLAPLFAGGIAVVALTLVSLSKDAHDAQFQKDLAAANARSEIALKLAQNGVPASGPLDMLANDPELRAESIFEDKCSVCHLLGEFGDAKKHNGPALDGWGTEAWILQMLHDPDSDSHFGKTPYAGEMPSMDTPSKDNPNAKVMSKDDMKAAATFLASQAAPDEKHDAALVAAGEKIISTRCTGCHLYKGEGDDGDEELAPELSGYGSEAWVIAQVTNPATKATYREQALDPKRKRHMPKFDGELSAADIALVSRWTRNRGLSSQPAL
jgi:ubiquinol-cytochrome c reductase cytochrome b subunit